MAVNKEQLLKEVGILAMLAAIGAALWSYTSILNEQLLDQVKKNMKSVAVQSVFTLKTEIEGQEKSLIEIAERIGATEFFDAEEAVRLLRDIDSRYPFKRMGVALPDGSTYTTDGTEFNIGNREYFLMAQKGQTTVSQKLEDYTDGASIVVISTPVFADNSIQAVLFATYNVSELSEILSTTFYNSDNTFCIIRENGDVVMDDIHSLQHSSNNIFERIVQADNENSKAAADIADLIKRGESGSVEIIHGGKKYLQVSPLKVNDWYLLNIVSSSVMDETRNGIMKVTYIFCMGVGALVILFVAYIIRFEHKKHQELERILYVDPLTGGYTYQRFLVEARKRLNEDTRNAAYIVMDIEQFKLVNELFGQEEGDRVLRFIFALWKRWIQTGELYSRRIADHFVVLAFYKTKEELLERVEDFVNTIRRESSERFAGYMLRPSIGVYLIQDHFEDLQSMQNNAVLADSSIREEKGLFYGVFDQDFKKRTLQNKLLEDQMEQAYDKKEFIVYYQPKYNSFTGKLNGAEALVRWRKEDGTLIAPDRFIPLAEKKGFIVKLDQYIFQEVCRQQRNWKESGKALVPISVNLSREHLKERKFIEEYGKILKESKMEVQYLELELTESALVEDLSVTRSVVDELHRRGVRILMDDFGTGYSSLMMLKSIHIDVMKLDKSFVDDYKDPRGEKIIKCVINLAQSLGFGVTAEGVENQEQFELLKALGCDTIQGYYFARPMPAEEFGRLLKEEKV